MLLFQMIVEPEQRVPDFIKAGADIVSVHCEQSSTIHLHRTVNQVRIFYLFIASCRHFFQLIDIMLLIARRLKAWELKLELSLIRAPHWLQ